jgi:hypothetical protein
MSNIPYGLVITTMLISLLSIIIGSLLIYILIFKLKSHSPDKVVMIIVTTFDLLWSLQKLVYDSLTLVHGTEIYNSESTLCQVNAFTIGTVFRISIWLIAILAMMRFFNGCLKTNLNPWIWYSFILFNISVSLTLGIYSFVHRLGVQSSSKTQCISFTQANTSSNKLLIFQIIYLTLGALVLLACYMANTIYIGKSLNSSINQAKSNNLKKVENYYKRQKLITIGNFVVICIVYLLAFVPPIATFILRATQGIRRTSTVDGFIIVCGQLLSLFNHLLTIILHPGANKEFFDFVKKTFRVSSD